MEQQSMQECQKAMYHDIGSAVSRAYRKTAQVAGTTCTQAVRYGREHFGASTLMALGMGFGMGLYLGGSYKKSRLAYFTRPLVRTVAEVSRGIFR